MKGNSIRLLKEIQFPHSLGLLYLSFTQFCGFQVNPCDPHMQSIVNEKIKFRDSFRPFTPVCIFEEAEHYFEKPFESEYMLFTTNIHKELLFESLLPAVTHVDNSCRLQALKLVDNQFLYNLLIAFKKYSGFPILLNTLFNIRGEPIVCNPKDALDCFHKTDIDLLVMGNYLIKKCLEKSINKWG